MRSKGTYRPSLRVGKRASRAVKHRMWAGGWARKSGRKYVLNPRRRRRRNPGGGGRGVVGGLKRNLRDLLQPRNYVEAAQVALGLGGALALPVLIARWTKQPVLNRGLAGAATSAVSAAALATVASMAGQHRLAAKLFAGGVLAAVLKGAVQLVPGDLLRKVLPLGELSKSGATSAPGAVNGLGYYGTGVGEWVNPNAFSGVGEIISPEQLIAGEAFYGQPSGVSEFLQLNPGGVGEYAYMNPATAGALPQVDSLLAPGSERF